MSAGLLLTLLAVAPPVQAQYFSLSPDRDSATVGDIITLHGRIHIRSNHAIADPMLEVPDPMPDGVRIISLDSITHSGDTSYNVTAKIAYYRTGSHEVPRLAALIRLAGAERAVRLGAEPERVEIVPVAPAAGTPQLKDIADLTPLGGWVPYALAGGALAAVGALAVLWRRRRARTPIAQPVLVTPVPTVDPYARALANLDAVASEHWAARGDPPRHYGGVARVLQDYLTAVGSGVRPSLTASETLGRLPRRMRSPNAELLLGTADLVKFASVRPDEPAAAAYVEDAREVLGDWNRAGEESDAVR